MSIRENLSKIKTKITAACGRVGRDPSTVRILAVSKLQPIEKIKEAYEAGQRDFAENYIQEALEKIESKELRELKIDWHLIGRIQSNKIKLLDHHFAWIHSIDRVSAALELGTRVKPQNILLQFNVAGEATKGGAGEEELLQLMHSIRVNNLLGVKVCGLMVMPPLVKDAEAARPHFVRAREMLAELRSDLSVTELQQHPMNELSMGTSQDFQVAIEEGSTWVRIGTELFGQRPVEVKT